MYLPPPPLRHPHVPLIAYSVPGFVDGVYPIMPEPGLSERPSMSAEGTDPRALRAHGYIIDVQ